MRDFHRETEPDSHPSNAKFVDCINHADRMGQRAKPGLGLRGSSAQGYRRGAP